MSIYKWHLGDSSDLYYGLEDSTDQVVLFYNSSGYSPTDGDIAALYDGTPLGPITTNNLLFTSTFDDYDATITGVLPYGYIP
jgi:hypothetical protein